MKTFVLSKTGYFIVTSSAVRLTPARKTKYAMHSVIHKLSKIADLSDLITLQVYIKIFNNMVQSLNNSKSITYSITKNRVGVFVSLSKRHLLPKSTGNTQE